MVPIQKFSHRKLWSENEIKILKENYPKFRRPTLLKLLPGRSPDAINSKAFLMGIKGKMGESKSINTALNGSMSYIIGVVCGDGSLRHYTEKNGSEHFCVTLSVKDRDFMENFVRQIENLGGHCNTFCSKDGMHTANMTSKILYNFLREFDMKELLYASNEIKIMFLKGFFDSEGYATDNNGSLDIGLINKRKDVILLYKKLLEFMNITSHIYEQKGSSFNPQGIYWNLRIFNKMNVKLFYDKIGFSINRKQQILKEYFSKVIFSEIEKAAIGLIEYKPRKNFYEYGRDQYETVLNLRKEGMKYSDISKMTQIPIGTFTKWLRKEGRPFRSFIEQRGVKNSSSLRSM